MPCKSLDYRFLEYHLAFWIHQNGARGRAADCPEFTLEHPLSKTSVACSLTPDKGPTQAHIFDHPFPSCLPTSQLSSILLLFVDCDSLFPSTALTPKHKRPLLTKPSGERFRLVQRPQQPPLESWKLSPTPSLQQQPSKSNPPIPHNALPPTFTVAPPPGIAVPRHRQRQPDQ